MTTLVPSHTATTRRLLVVLLIAVLGAGTAGCANNDGDAVVVIGDSITSLGEGSIKDELGDRYDFTISGKFGHTVAQMMPAAEFLANRNYDQAIINLGSNDVIGALDVAASIETLRQMISLFDSARCIHLVTINEHMVNLGNGAYRTAEGAAFNAALAEIAESDDRISLIDWQTETAATLNDSAPPYSTLTQDSIHPTTEGNERLNQLYGDALRSC